MENFPKKLHCCCQPVQLWTSKLWKTNWIDIKSWKRYQTILVGKFTKNWKDWSIWSLITRKSIRKTPIWGDRYTFLSNFNANDITKHTISKIYHISYTSRWFKYIKIYTNLLISDYQIYILDQALLNNKFWFN
jgi:hypothetical protein